MSLVPFAIEKSTNRFVSIDDVPQGNACNCKCPSCGTALIAKKGDIKEWHFAHDSTKYKEAKKECDYSFYVSIAMMAKQLVEDQAQIMAPSYHVVIAIEGPITKEIYRRGCSITGESLIKFDKCNISMHDADIFGLIKGIPVLIFLDYPGRPFVPYDLSDQSKRAILVIDLAEWGHEFKSLGTVSGVKDSLNNFLFNSVAGKKWKYHPRQDRILADNQESLKMEVEQKENEKWEQRLKTQEQLNQEVIRRQHGHGQKSFDDISEFTEKLNAVNYKCSRCGISWTGTNHGRQLCPKCFLPPM